MAKRQRGRGPVEGSSVPALDNQLLPEAEEKPLGEASTTTEGEEFFDRPWASLLAGEDEQEPQAQDLTGLVREKVLVGSSSAAGRTHVENLLASLSERRGPSSLQASAMLPAGPPGRPRAEIEIEPSVSPTVELQLEPQAPTERSPQSEGRPGVLPGGTSPAPGPAIASTSPAPGPVIAGPPAAAPSNVAPSNAEAPRPPGSLRLSDALAAAQAGPQSSDGTSAPPVAAPLPSTDRPAAAAAARALALFAAGPAATNGASGPTPASSSPIGTSSGGAPYLSGAAAARALSSLASGSARGSTGTPAPSLTNVFASPPSAPKETSAPKGTSAPLGSSAAGGSGINETVPAAGNGTAASAAPVPRKPANEVAAEADDDGEKAVFVPKDDILPTKSKSFFRLRSR
jgi:hypothetical protein